MSHEIHTFEFELSDIVVNELLKLSKETNYTSSEIISILILSYLEDCHYSINTLYHYFVKDKIKFI